MKNTIVSKMSGGGAVNMKNFETSIPSIVVYKLIFLFYIHPILSLHLITHTPR